MTHYKQFLQKARRAYEMAIEQNITNIELTSQSHQEKEARINILLDYIEKKNKAHAFWAHALSLRGTSHLLNTHWFPKTITFKGDEEDGQN